MQSLELSMETSNECEITPTDDNCTMQLNFRRIPTCSRTYTCLFNSAIDIVQEPLWKTKDLPEIPSGAQDPQVLFKTYFIHGP